MGAFRERAFVGLQHLLPQHALTRMVRALARSRIPLLRRALIGAFLRRYPVDLAEAERPDPRAYESFNDFFTRRLRPGARPPDPDPRAVLCPVDGVVSQAGTLEDGTLLQAKGIRYAAAALLADEARAAGFAGGRFATLYLAPQDYHRIHMPLAGTLLRACLVPGDLYSVDAATTAGVPGLFARNERAVCLFDTAAGPMAVVLVGALFVGSMSLSWAGELRPARAGGGVEEIGDGGALQALDRGAELGWFNMGSTVIVLLPPGRATLRGGLAPGVRVRVGERLATLA